MIWFCHKGMSGDVSQEEFNELMDKFKNAVDDDLNIPLAIAYVWEAAKTTIKSDKIYKLLLDMDEIISLDFDKICPKEDNVSETLEPEIMELINRRIEARENKDYELSDVLRNLLNEKGIAVKDTKEGMKWERLK